MLPEPEITSALAHFGVAGLIGWMWLSERRSAAQREQQLTEAHNRIQQQHTHASTLLKALDRNTRALTSLEKAVAQAVAQASRLCSPTSAAAAQKPGQRRQSRRRRRAAIGEVRTGRIPRESKASAPPPSCSPGSPW